MALNYSGRLLDRLILLAVQQTAAIKLNPDDTEYAAARVAVMKSLVRALWQARAELHSERRLPKP